jgi:glycine hydroxymethyltransferase
MTTRGFKESEFIEIANLIDQVIQHPESESNHKTVTGRVKEMCDQYPLY